MRFKDFLLEAKVDVSKYQKNLDIMIRKKLFFFRGISEGTMTNKTWHGDLELAEQFPRLASRKSISGSNLLLNLTTRWIDLPRRTHSYFTTQDIRHVVIFGTTWLIVPRDDVKMFAWAPEDLNDTSGTNKILDRVNEFVLSIVREKPGPLRNAFVDIGHKHGVEGAFNDKKGEIDIQFPAEKIDNFAACIDEMLARRRELLSDVEYREINWALDNLNRTLQSAGYTSVAEVFDNVTPKEYRVEACASLADVPRAGDYTDELWFEGGYLAIRPREGHMMDLDRDELADLLKQVKVLK